ncbi:MAG TPA: hypothetical protein VKM72_30490 [Thermoanaerobaculia bacterium]|nr:hypothetical protein [Thermoanaerobaculia bacterium]
MRRLCATLALVPLVLLASRPGGTATPPGQIQLQRLNRSYSEIAPDILPVVEGPLTVRLSSPRNQITVRNHLLRLEPGSGGSHSADLSIEFQGKGWLVADVEAGPMATRLQDEVLVPPQVAKIQGRVRIRRVQGGYGITPEQLPEKLGVRIQSGIGRQLVNVCDGASILLALDCPSLEKSLSRAVIPLPAAGEEFLLEDTELTAVERGQIDSYLLGQSAGQGS